MNDHKLVPVEPNLDMDKAGEKALREHCSNYRSKHAWIGGHLAAYKAMLEAAPTNPPEISSTSELNALAERVGDGELARLERELAEEFAQSIVECHGCPEFVNGERSGWLQCPKDEDEASIFTSSARYLDLRGLLERHPEHPDWVRVKEQ